MLRAALPNPIAQRTRYPDSNARANIEGRIFLNDSGALLSRTGAAVTPHTHATTELNIHWQMLLQEPTALAPGCKDQKKEKTRNKKITSLPLMSTITALMDPGCHMQRNWL